MLLLLYPFSFVLNSTFCLVHALIPIYVVVFNKHRNQLALIYWFLRLLIFPCYKLAYKQRNKPWKFMPNLSVQIFEKVIPNTAHILLFNSIQHVHDNSSIQIKPLSTFTVHYKFSKSERSLFDNSKPLGHF